MSKITINTLSSSETARLLGRALGAERNWAFFLADCNRGQTNFHGLTLEPVGLVHDRCSRPVYKTSDVADFIRAARAFVSHAPGYRARTVEMDLDAYQLPWQMRRLKLIGEGA